MKNANKITDYRHCPKVVLRLYWPQAHNINANYRKLKPEQKSWPSNNQTNCNQYFSKLSLFIGHIVKQYSGQERGIFT